MVVGLKRGLGMLTVLLTIAACGALPTIGERGAGGTDEPTDGSEPAAQVEPFVAPDPPLPDPQFDGLAITLTKFVTLPESKTNPRAPRGDKLDRHNRINYLGEVPDGSGRLYVPDLNGTLYLLRDGEPRRYLDAARKVGPDLWTSQGFGSGFGFVAFHPGFADNGTFYTVHTEARDALESKRPDLGSSSDAVVHGVITEWKTDQPSADTFDGTSREVMRLAFPAFIHGIQQIAFNPNAKEGDEDYGLLYIAVGDGGAVGKAAEDGKSSTVPQDLQLPQGKILRIDPRTEGSSKWTVPATNPFVDQTGALGEIYAIGLRDPYRFSWDSAGTHQLLLGSMGENRAESIYDVHAGDNFGWPEREGPFAASMARSCDVTRLPDPDEGSFTYPVASYSHLPAAGAGPCDDTGHAVIGGFVYRGKLAALRGRYVFGDGVSGRMFHADAATMQHGGALAEVHELALMVDGKKVTMRGIASDPGVLTAGKPRVDFRMGIDAAGELYVLSKSNGTIWQITDASTG